MKTLTLLLLLVSLSSCTKEADVEKYAQMEEWDSYTIEGYCWFGCSQEDFWKTKFTATKKGKTFEGCTCSGFLFKNTTLRLD